MKFLCDQMLAGLGKWLRAAGYDTEIIENSEKDREIHDYALKEQRCLLTRDHHFLQMKMPEKSMIFLNGNSIIDCVRELNRVFDVNWLYQPFSRCLVCNTLLEKPNDQMLEEIPSKVRSEAKQVWYCSHCKKVFWEGSHTVRMSKQLHLWQMLK